MGGSEKVQKFADVIQGWSPICGLLASKESQVLVQHSVHCRQLPFCPPNVVSSRAVGISEILGGEGSIKGKHHASIPTTSLGIQLHHSTALPAYPVPTACCLLEAGGGVRWWWSPFFCVELVGLWVPNFYRECFSIYFHLKYFTQFPDKCIELWVKDSMTASSQHMLN